MGGRRLYSSSRESTNDGTRRETDARDLWETDARETSIARTSARGVSSFSVRGAGEGCARRFDSIRSRSDLIRSDRSDSFHPSIHPSIRAVIRRRRWIGLDWIGLDDAGRWVDDVLVDVRVRVRDGERWDGGGTRDARDARRALLRAQLRPAREDRRRWRR